MWEGFKSMTLFQPGPASFGERKGWANLDQMGFPGIDVFELSKEGVGRKKKKRGFKGEFKGYLRMVH